MSSEVSVEVVLRKISHHNTDVLGCVAAQDGQYFSTLPELYDLVDVKAVVEYASNMFVISDALESGEDAFQEVFLEFQGHSFIVRKLHAGTLILVAKPIKRGAFRKMQLGLNLFLKPLERALAQVTGAEEEVPADKASRGVRGLRRVFGSLA